MSRPCKKNGCFSNQHLCFQCGKPFEVSAQETCIKCQWKKCPNGHCQCTMPYEAQEYLMWFYHLLCEPSGNGELNDFWGYKPWQRIMIYTYLSERCNCLEDC